MLWWELLHKSDILATLRVVHGYGPHCRFCCMGVAGTGTVSDLPTCANTTPVAGYPWVSATDSATHCTVSFLALTLPLCPCCPSHCHSHPHPHVPCHHCHPCTV